MKPELVAYFDLDKSGAPKFELDEEGTKHYAITLGVDGVPEDTAGVQYELDDSYYDPIRDVWAREAKAVGARGVFAEPITSYGDFTVAAKAITTEGPLKVRSRLSRALYAAYGANPSTAVAMAIREIEQL